MPAGRSVERKGTHEMRAEVTETGVLVGGKPMRILSGEIHYFRIHPDYWEDRLAKMKACGLNTVATYMPWNLHEPKPGGFDFGGMLDINRFIRIAADLGLYVMVRPGPYICSEWDFGGFPSWLMTIPGIRLRCSSQPYMEAVKRYFDAVLKALKPQFCNHGGPVIAIQIENGYASYGNDVAYLKSPQAMVIGSGFGGIVFTADGDSDTRLATESIAGIWKTMMLGDNPLKGVEALNRQQDLPPMVSEFWGGAGTRNGVVPTRAVHDVRKTEDLDTLLAAGGHVNVYMFAGGTNFGFMNGGLNLPPKQEYTSFTTSYDVRAPLSEPGQCTPKYHMFREVFRKYNPEFADLAAPEGPVAKAFGRVQLTSMAPLLPNSRAIAERMVQSPSTLTMEEVGQDYGFILYRTKVRHQAFPLPVTLVEPRDHAWVFVDGKRVASFNRNAPDGKPFPATVTLEVPVGGVTLEILVENQGRFNFSWNLEDNHKGLTRGVVLNNQQFQMDWEILTLPMRDLSALAYAAFSDVPACPAFFKGTIGIGEPADTFIRIPGGSRGFCLVNGFNIGRYENAGPQFTLYVPAPLLKTGVNTVEIMELESLSLPVVDLVDQPDIR